ncbi:sn-glycerol-3-phosphate ABC transporter ATP-binding protein UgpC [Pelagibacterium nitratireducens]|uniref:Sn-glycerol-3-phosphate ABC transporter ATP-binding protein UgpC n=1 Tax=Pelagibacterium nitratireducens TaxID=1046114 RepID=A0ABZ2HVT5_9HYPH
MASIAINQARKVYSGNVTALHGIDLAVEPGELMVLVGPSGCGKSTLLRMIAGLETITSGTIAIDGRVVNTVEPAARDIAMVFQNYALYPHMSVRGNLEYGLKNRGVGKQDRQALVAEAARILELEPYLERRPAALSGGQRQRVAMGRAIVRKPRAFLFDEPLSNLDAKLRGQMRVEIRRLQKALDTTAIYVTHDQLEAMTLADRLVVMNGGNIEQVGTPTELYERPRTTFVARFIGSPGMNLLNSAALAAQGFRLPDFLPQSGCTIGIRPEDILLDDETEPGLALNGRVEAVEILGKESLVYLALGGMEDLVTVRAVGSRWHTGATATLHLPYAHLHLFDTDSGERFDAR